MTTADPKGAGAYEALYLSAHEGDALVSCPGRLLSERAQGLRPLVVVAFSTGSRVEQDEASRALERLGFDQMRLGLRPAAERSDVYKKFARTVFDRHTEDDEILAQLAERLTDLALQTKARHIYLPLGVGRHVDHRLCHDAGLRAVQELTGRNVFLYEERPEALLPGAMRIRLSELGARLPPAAADIRDDASLARVLWSYSRAPFLKAEQVSLLERARATGRLTARYRAARAWNPLRALGVRLQPVLEAMDGADLEGLLGVLSSAEPRISSLFGSRERLAREARRYGQRLSGRAYAERYWLLLPPREEGGLVALPLAGDDLG